MNAKYGICEMGEANFFTWLRRLLLLLLLEEESERRLSRDIAFTFIFRHSDTESDKQTVSRLRNSD